MVTKDQNINPEVIKVQDFTMTVADERLFSFLFKENLEGDSFHH